MGDDMGIHLAAADVMGSEAKMKKEDVEDSGTPQATRQELECVFTLEGKTGFDVSEIFSRPPLCHPSYWRGNRPRSFGHLH